MRVYVLFFVLVLLILPAAGVFAQADEAWTVETISFYIRDSLDMHAWLHVPKAGDAAPLYVLLPMRGHTHESYDVFLDSLAARFASDTTEERRSLPFMLSCDLRGHGQSTERMRAALNYRDMSEAEYKKIPGDVDEITSHVAGDTTYNIDLGDIVIIGASIGANAAIMAAQLIPNVTRVVMLSPGEDYLGLEPGPAAKDYDGRALIYTSEGDTYSHNSAKTLAGLNEEAIELKVFEGSHHGTDIINNRPEAMTYLLDWLLE